MLVALFLMLQAEVVGPAAKQQDIVVMARRLKDWRGKMSGNAGGSRCKTVRSTGDRDLDQIACDAMRHCASQMSGDFQLIARLKGAEQEQRLHELNRRLEACGEEQQQLRVADLVERRWLQRSAANGR